MKTVFFSLILMATMTSVTSCGSGNGKPKTLIVYYTRTHNTENVAKEIQRHTGADMFRVETVKAYPDDYDEVVEASRVELLEQARPAIKGGVTNIRDYDIVFIGYPIWWDTYPMAMATFLESHDLSGKIVIPFATHGGDGHERSFPHVQKATPKSKHRDGIGLVDADVSGSAQQIESWLKKIEVIK